MSKQFYSDGREWDQLQREHVEDIIELLKEDLAKDDPEAIRRASSWLFDAMFSDGTVYEVGRGIRL